MYKIPANTLFLGKRLIYVPECHSTNTLALESALQPATSDGTVVITDHQTAGRGQRGNTWEAEQKKNLTFSIIFKPTFLNVKDQFLLNIFTSLAIHDFLREKTTVMSKIKWPNDILVEDRKICGILIENQIRGAQVSNAIVGIGFNVNQSSFQSITATSLRDITNIDYELDIVLDQLLSFIEARYLQLKQGRDSLLKHEYLQNLYWIGEKRDFMSDGTSFKGAIQGIDGTGRLVVEVNGVEKTYDIKEISYVR